MGCCVASRLTKAAHNEVGAAKERMDLFIIVLSEEPTRSAKSCSSLVKSWRALRPPRIIRVGEQQHPGGAPAPGRSAGHRASAGNAGHDAVRASRDRGSAGFPVNPEESEGEAFAGVKRVRGVRARTAMVSVYLPPPVLLRVLPEIAARGCGGLWLSTGTESDEVLAEAARLGLNAIQACSIVAIGVSPGAF